MLQIMIILFINQEPVTNNVLILIKTILLLFMPAR